MQNLIKQDGPQQEEDKEIVHNTLSAKKNDLRMASEEREAAKAYISQCPQGPFFGGERKQEQLWAMSSRVLNGRPECGECNKAPLFPIPTPFGSRRLPANVGDVGWNATPGKKNKIHI